MATKSLLLIPVATCLLLLVLPAAHGQREQARVFAGGLGRCASNPSKIISNAPLEVSINGSTLIGKTMATGDEQNNGEAAAFEMSVTGPRRYCYDDLAAATGDFTEDNLIGRGGFGSVYQGRLPGSCNEDESEEGQLQRQEVAIKKLNSASPSNKSRKAFEAEVNITGRLRHRNLVQLLGWCDSRRGLLLVYELMPEGSLDRHIYSTEKVLNWPERYKIILGLGSALHYLHQDWDQRIVHGDIKPSNIMLDSSYNAKLGDFGLARLGDHGSGPQTTDIVKGTKGYIDPEFVNSHRRSTESDIYSFGVVLLEIVSGQPPVDPRDPSFSLLKWIETLYYCHVVGRHVLDAADVRLRGDEAHDRQMERALLLGLWCTHRDPGNRPSIAEAMEVLQSEEWELPALSLHIYGKLQAANATICYLDHGHGPLWCLRRLLR